MTWFTKKIDHVYTGRYAEKYEAQRSTSERWQHEQAVIGPMLAQIRPGETVLDVAAGTGRWLPAYAEAKARPTLLDSSKDMLEQAQAKARSLGVDATIIAQSATASEPFPRADWVVTTRFFNWIPLASVEAVLRKMIATGAHTIFFTISFEPADLPRSEAEEVRRFMRSKNLKSLLRLRRKGVYHLHREADVRALLARLGLAIEHEAPLHQRGGRRTIALRTAPTKRT
jgi:2-polyprenyl-3-methyl-5-hydroxy-6-metoxy-1,4-benzoquinol methylase